MFQKIGFFLLCSLLIFNGVRSLTQIKSYTAQVVSLRSVSENTANEQILKSLEKYKSHIDNCLGCDLIVFPEYGLTGPEILQKTFDEVIEYAISVPEVSTEQLCANATNHIILHLACAVQRQNVYAVVNLLEKVSNGSIYNTNVVFDPTGAIIAKYRKINLYGNEVKHLIAGTEVVTFRTNFNVTFGLLTCFDILFPNPSASLFKERAVTDVIMTTAWMSEVPFYTALGVQDGYAKKHGVNFIVAAYLDPEKCFGGSGIYMPGKLNKVNMPTSPGYLTLTETLDVIDVRHPETACNQRIQPRGIIGQFPPTKTFHTKPMSEIESYIYKTIDADQTEFNEEICKKNLCCKFRLTFDESLKRIGGVYRAVASESKCGVIACDDPVDLNTCGSRNESLKDAYFTSINIQLKLKDKANSYYFPVTSDLELLPIKYTLCENASTITLNHVNTQGLIFTGFHVSASSTIINVNLYLTIGSLIMYIVNKLRC